MGEEWADLAWKDHLLRQQKADWWSHGWEALMPHHRNQQEVAEECLLQREGRGGGQKINHYVPFCKQVWGQGSLTGLGADIRDDLQCILAGVVHAEYLLTTYAGVSTLLHQAVLPTR